MCFYLLLVPRCGHIRPGSNCGKTDGSGGGGSLIAFTNCHAVLEQLLRIHTESEAWTGDGLETVPFELPESCDPNLENVFRVPVGGFCCWDCWHSHSLIAQGETRQQVARKLFLEH